VGQVPRSITSIDVRDEKGAKVKYQVWSPFWSKLVAGVWVAWTISSLILHLA